MVKFNLEQSTSVGRMGCLKYWGDITVDHATPSYMIYTRAGHIPHLTWDAVNRFLHFNQKQIFQLTLPTLIESSESLRCFGEGISAYCSMPKGAPTHMSVLDPLGFMQHGFNDSKSISIWTKSGRKRIDVRTYMDVIKCCKSTTFETLLDFDTPRECSEKRLGKSISRTKDFCEAILNDSSTFKAHPIVTVGGGHSLKHREEFVQKLGSLRSFDAAHIYFLEFSHRPLNERLLNKCKHKSESEINSVGGKDFDSPIGDKEMSQSGEREIKNILSHILPHFTPEILRIITGAFSPSEVVELISCGIDLFDSSYAILLAESGKSFQLNEDFPFNSSFSIIDFTDKKLNDNFSPVHIGCSCYTCSKYTKGYLHHLVNVKELLAPMLLTM